MGYVQYSEVGSDGVVLVSNDLDCFLPLWMSPAKPLVDHVQKRRVTIPTSPCPSVRTTLGRELRELMKQPWKCNGRVATKEGTSGK